MISSRSMLSFMAVLAMACVAEAAIVYSGPVNIEIPNTGTGLYVNVIDGTTFTGPGVFPTFPGPGANYDFNIFGTATFSFFQPGASGMSPSATPDDRGLVATGPNDPASNLPLGTLIGPASVLNTNGSVSAANVVTGSDAIFGFRFRADTSVAANPDPTIHFGWARVNLTNGQPGTLIDYAFESTPLTAIPAGAVPEPSTLGPLAALVLLCLRRRK